MPGFQVTRPGLEKIIRAVEDKHRVKLDHDYLNQLVDEVHALRKRNEQAMLRYAATIVLLRAKYVYPRNDFALYEEALREYCR